MTSLLKLGTPHVDIGEPVVVIAGQTSDGAVIPTTMENFVLAGQVYNKADYPELYSKFGSFGTSVWTARTSGTTSGILALIYGNGLYVYGGAGGVLRSSTDAITWTSRTSGTTSGILALTYGNGLYVYAGEGGVLRSSTDAVTWTSRTSGTTSIIRALTYGNGIYVYAGDGGVLATSTDAVTWTARNSDTTIPIYALTYANGIYVYAGDTGLLATSTDTVTWTRRTSNTSVNIQSITYGNGLYIYVGYGSGQAIGTSTDTINWNTIDPGVAVIMTVAYGLGTYIIGSTGNPFLTSKNGIAWDRSFEVTGLSFTTALTYGNGLFVAGDLFGFILTTDLKSKATGLYDVNTQFLVPAYTYAPTLTATSYAPNSRAQYVTYVRAK